MSGKVWLVGAGPGDPDLLTRRAFKALQEADVVLHDDLVSAEVLALIPSTAQVHNVGKRCGKKNIQQHEINTLLVNFAQFGLRVVRLKIGDPLIFGRAGEEMDALRRAGVEYEIVPGITSALGAAASARIPLTHRESASAVAFLTSHQAKNTPEADWSAWVAARATLVIYMPGYEYAVISARLVRAGMSLETPCAVISRATARDEQVVRTTLAELSSAGRLPAPTLLFVGEAVGFGAERGVAPQAWGQIATATLPAIGTEAVDSPAFSGNEGARL
jgi:uroporphyrin-III C-methyltransferase